MDDLFIFTRGVAVGVVLLLCCKLWLQDRDLISGRFLLALMLGTLGYLVAALLDGAWWLQNIAMILAISVAALFWLFVQSVFYDWDQRGITLRAWHVVMVLLYTVLAFTNFWLYRFPVDIEPLVVRGLFYLDYAFRFVFITLSFRAIVVGWRQDLVEARRQLRTLMTALGGGYILVISVVEVILADTAASMFLETGNSLLMLLLLMAVSSWLLVVNPKGLMATLDINSSVRTGELVEADGSNEALILSQIEQQWLCALEQYVAQHRGYQRSDLTISRLADQLTIPEHKLRRLINQHLGYRNFNDFLSHYRIAEAAQRLSDASEQRLPILTIAMDAGYASLTPFNRAFKEKHQMTPSEFRRQKCGVDG